MDEVFFFHFVLRNLPCLPVQTWFGLGIGEDSVSLVRQLVIIVRVSPDLRSSMHPGL